MDLNLQPPHDVVPELLQAVRAGADLAVASPYAPGASTAGLSGRFRTAVRKSVCWVAKAVFSAARCTTDPMSGFFRVRQRSIAGLEFRPVAFKILLELSVRLPGIRVRDVPFTLAPRYAGESKATLSQGILFGKHVISLVVHVPLAALVGKVAVSTGAGMVAFVSGVAPLTDLRLSPSGPSLGTVVTSSLVTVAVYVPPPSAAPSGAWVLGPRASSGWRGCSLWLGGSGAPCPHRHGQGASRHRGAPGGPAAGVVDGLPPGRRAILAAPVVTLAGDLSLQVLARRLTADFAWWIDSVYPAAALPRVEQLVTAEAVSHVTRSGRPVVLTELPSSRRQTRINLGGYSVNLIPQLASAGMVVRIAAVARTGRSSFSGRDLHASVAWCDRLEAGAEAAAQRPPAAQIGRRRRLPER
jgi:hypothetical protein